MKLEYIGRTAVIAALYAALTYIFAPISYGPVQFRVSEALTVLPFVEGAAVPGLAVGCMVANILGGYGPWDIFGGSLLTLIAAYLTYYSPRPFLAVIPPIVVNGLGVGYYLSILTGLPYLFTAGQVFVGELGVLVLLGYPLLLLVLKFRGRLPFKRVYT